jgi:DNA-directed RNA polymerase subunit RPC12/RpoP
MPRKPRVRTRVSGAPPAHAVRTGKRMHQCSRCGALVSPIFGAGDGSWCPACEEMDSIVYDIGKIPIPPLYGSWLHRQREKQAAQEPPPPGTAQSISVITRPGDPTMKHAKTHTGTYSCLNCCVEYDLVGETHLKCDECGAPLVRGTLDERCEDDDDEEPPAGAR